MIPFGFLGGAHFTSITADPVAFTIGGLSSSGSASAVLAYVLVPTPQAPEGKIKGQSFPQQCN